MKKRKPITDFEDLRNGDAGEKRILEKLHKYEKNLGDYLEPWWNLSRVDSKVYPSQGLLLTPYDGLGVSRTQMLSQEQVIQTLRLRMFFLELFNHPYRLEHLNQVNKQKFSPPQKIESVLWQKVMESGMALAIGDIGAGVVPAKKGRISRTERYAQGPFVKLGKQARSLFIGSASPDVWNSGLAISTMAASLCLAGIPRNGVLSDVTRQADIAEEVFLELDNLATIVLSGRSDKQEVLRMWRRNVMGVVEASPEKALTRTEALYKKGVRCFRVYSPEPGTGPVATTEALRKEFGNDIEIFSGQIVNTEQAKLAEEAGVDAIIVGIGGGGRCITGVRSGSVIDWPELVWKLRGEVGVPVIVEGGATDHVAVTLLLGASGICVSRAVAGGTIESPGGLLFCADEGGKLFKPYGGEASARTKYLDGKLLPFGVPAFVEGETTRAELSYIKHALPTLTYNLHLLIEDAILALVFRGVETVQDLQSISPSPLRQITNLGVAQMRTH